MQSYSGNPNNIQILQTILFTSTSYVTHFCSRKHNSNNNVCSDRIDVLRALTYAHQLQSFGSLIVVALGTSTSVTTLGALTTYVYPWTDLTTMPPSDLSTNILNAFACQSN